MRIPSASLLVPCALLLAACGAEQAQPARRDLTLLDPAAESAVPPVVSAREMAVTRTEPGVTQASPRARPAPAPVRTRALPARKVSAPAPDASMVASVPVEEPVAAGEEPAAAGAGEALAPGQIVKVIPATSAPSPAPVPVGDFSTERGIRARPVIIIGDDRCIPGRGEVIPRGRPHGFRARL